MTKKLFKRLILLLSIIMPLVSCSKALLFEDSSSGLDGKEGKLIISGIVTDRVTGTTIKGISISFQCDAPDFEKITVETDSEGIFIIKTTGFTSTINACVTARDTQDNYLAITRDLKIDWKGESYDNRTGLFAINDCNFQLQSKNRILPEQF